LSASPQTWGEASWPVSKRWPQASQEQLGKGGTQKMVAAMTWEENYSENNVTVLKGYCGVPNPAGISTIWDAFQQTREIASHRHNLRVTMFKWAKDIGKDINKAPFFTKQTVKDIAGLQFNPREAVPTYSSAQQGIDPHVPPKISTRGQDDQGL
jgi:hypothetical protein